MSDLNNHATNVWKTVGCAGNGLKACSLLLTPLWIALIVVGCIYLHKCTLEPKIPIWMIVYGAAALVELVFSVMSLIWDCKANRGKHLARRNYDNLCDVFSSLLRLFIFIWIIVGSVWIFTPFTDYISAGRPNCSVTPKSPLCCEDSFYMFAFVVAIFGCASIGLVLLLFCLAASFGCCCAGEVLAGYSAI